MQQRCVPYYAGIPTQLQQGSGSIISSSWKQQQGTSSVVATRQWHWIWINIAATQNSNRFAAQTRLPTPTVAPNERLQTTKLKCEPSLNSTLSVYCSCKHEEETKPSNKYINTYKNQLTLEPHQNSKLASSNEKIIEAQMQRKRPTKPSQSISRLTYFTNFFYTLPPST